MIDLNALEVVRAGMARFEKGELQAQNHPYEEGCMYRDQHGDPCVVGAGLTDEQVAILRETTVDAVNGNSASIGQLIDAKIVRLTHAGRRDNLGRQILECLQEAHDEGTLKAAEIEDALLRLETRELLSAKRRAAR